VASVPVQPVGYVDMPVTVSGEYPTAGGPPRRRSMVVPFIVGMVVVALVAAGILFGPRLFGNNTNTATNPPSHSAGPTSSASASAAPPDLFAGTPAEQFKVGADAIVLPPAKAVTGFTQAQVATDLNAVKNAMVAARLDPAMLVDHDTSTLIGLLAPDGRSMVQSNFTKNTAFAYATRLQGNTDLTTDPIRASGTITFSAQKVDNLQALVIVTNYIWVYPVAAHRLGVGANLVVVRDQINWTFYTPASVEGSSDGLWIKRARAFGSNLDCNVVNNQDLVALAPMSISEDKTEAGNAYNLNANFDNALFVC
jgi:hypothetical protein